MGFFGDLNGSSNINWEYDTEGFEYKKLKELDPDTEYPIHGVFITKDNGYGLGAVAILDDCYVNLSARQVEDVRAIISNAAAVDNIKSGLVGIKVREFDSKKYKRKGWDIDWVEF